MNYDHVVLYSRSQKVCEISFQTLFKCGRDFILHIYMTIYKFTSINIKTSEVLQAPTEVAHVCKVYICTIKHFAHFVDSYCRFAGTIPCKGIFQDVIIFINYAVDSCAKMLIQVSTIQLAILLYCCIPCSP